MGLLLGCRALGDIDHKARVRVQKTIAPRQSSAEGHQLSSTVNYREPLFRLQIVLV